MRTFFAVCSSGTNSTSCVRYPLELEQLGAERVRDERRKTLLREAVPENRPEQRALDLPVGLLLAAGNGQDHVRLPANRLCKRLVGGGVAGVEADDEVDLLTRVEAGDVPLLEAETLRPGAGCERRARVDHVVLEVEPHDLHLTAAQLGQQMVDREGEIRLAAAEVDHAERPIGPE